ncbi:unannotated protein [freshwater metagenome]|uniref:Unannotated protein n=1 Tax=freshwater metagenome TaxID=449393 RepID=A0A6J6Q121_9ZZZZ
MKTVGLTPKPPSVALPANVFSTELLANSAIAEVKRSAIPLFRSGATAIVER